MVYYRDWESVWNQVADSLNLSQRLREVWREDFTISQCYVAVQWRRRREPWVEFLS